MGNGLGGNACGLAIERRDRPDVEINGGNITHWLGDVDHRLIVFSTHSFRLDFEGSLSEIPQADNRTSPATDIIVNACDPAPGRNLELTGIDNVPSAPLVSRG